MKSLSLLIALAVLAVPGNAQQKQWYQEPVKGIGINIWAPEWYPESITKFDAEKLAESVAKSGSQVSFTFQGFSQDHFGLSYFPSAIGRRHPNLKGRDHLKEYTDALHKRNVKIMGYYSFPDKEVSKQHPEWRQYGPDGKEIGGGNLGARLCPNSPYHEYFVSRVTEIASNYELDGFMLDSAGFSSSEPGCYCRYCQSKFRERYGRELPRRRGYDEDWRRFVQFRFDCVQKLHQDVRDAFRRVRPQMIYTHNAFDLRGAAWGVGEDYERSTQLDDIVTSIGRWVRSPGDYSPGVREPLRSLDTIWKTGLLTRYLRGISGKPVWMQMGAFMYGRDYQALPLEELKLAAYTIVTNGGSPVYITNAFPDGSVDEVLSDRLAAVLNEVGGKSEYLGNATDLSFAALYFSRDSQLFSDSIKSSRGNYLASFEGAYKAMMEAHIPFEIIGREGLSSGKLGKFKVLILPDTTVLSDSQSEVIGSFVQNGGALIATARASLIDGNGNARRNFALSKVMGADYVNPLNYQISFIKTAGHAIAAGIDPRESIPLRKSLQMKVAAHSGTETPGRLMPPAAEVVPGVRTFTFGDDVPPGPVTDAPAILASTTGKGRSVYFAGDITGAYGKYGDPSLRKLFANAIRWANGGKLPLEVEAPLGVEVTCFRQGSRYVIHLMNYITSQLRMSATTGGPAAEECIPVRDLSIRLQLEGKTPKRAYLASGKRELKYRMKDGAIVLTVPKLEVHEMVVIE